MLGVLLIPLPGPGSLIALGGLALLGTEFSGPKKASATLNKVARAAVKRAKDHRAAKVEAARAAEPADAAAPGWPGGTAWLGREIAAQFLSRGDEVTCLARGSSGSVAPGSLLIRADRTQPGAYDSITSTRWDEVVELSYDADLVSSALKALADQAAHWTLISTTSVYASNSDAGADESSSVVQPNDLSDYGQAKVNAERVSASVLGDRLLIARPGLIGGPGDESDRFGYWVARLALAGAGRVLAPVGDSVSVQVVDVRDLAAWVVSAAHDRIVGTFNVVGDSRLLSEVLALAADVAGFSGELVERNDDWLAQQNVNYWAGPRSLPLWVPPSAAGLTQRSNAAFIEAGGKLRSLHETVLDTLADEDARGLNRERRSGLTRDEELELLDSLAQPLT